MPRIAKKYMKELFFHIIAQGINKEYIFENNIDKKQYEKLILLCQKKANINILAYCIMSNHVHILIKVKVSENMSEFMHKVNTTYAIYYNKRYNRTGYVFKNRYKSQTIQSIKHLYRCIDYIHDNPVKAGICKNRNYYEFSSFDKIYSYNQTKTRKMLESQFLNESNTINIQKNEISEIDDIEFIDDIEEDKRDLCSIEIEKYMQKYGISKEKIKEDKTKLKELIGLLRNRKISYRIMQEKLNIGRETLRRVNMEIKK